MEILKGVEIPQSPRKGGAADILRRMEVGDCIKPKQKAGYFITSINQLKSAKKNPMPGDFLVRTINHQTHVWRIA